VGTRVSLASVESQIHRQDHDDARWAHSAATPQAFSDQLNQINELQRKAA
jgi:hypothetical protein